MNYLYKLVTTEDVEINYDAFKEKELIECLATMRDIYFSLKQENQKYKEVIDKAIRLIEDTYYSKNTTDIDSIVLSSDKLIKVRGILKEVE